MQCPSCYSSVLAQLGPAPRGVRCSDVSWVPKEAYCLTLLVWTGGREGTLSRHTESLYSATLALSDWAHWCTLGRTGEQKERTEEKPSVWWRDLSRSATVALKTSSLIGTLECHILHALGVSLLNCTENCSANEAAS